MPRYDAFLSYASEELTTACDLRDHLGRLGFRIWFAPNELNTGDRLTTSIEEAMARCYYGIFLVSRAHLDKHWTKHELQTYRRAAIEGRKSVLPVLCGLSKDVLEQEQPSLANLVMSDMNKGAELVASELAKVLARGAGTICSIPLWMDPVSLFLKGEGEITVHARGTSGAAVTASIWEVLAHPRDGEFPLYLDGSLYSRRHLLWRAAGAFFYNPHLADARLSAGDIARLKAMFNELPEYRRNPEDVATIPYFGDDNS